MSTIIIRINTDNAAFDRRGGGREAARILRDLANKIEDEDVHLSFYVTIMDINGNSVGTMSNEKVT